MIMDFLPRGLGDGGMFGWDFGLLPPQILGFRYSSDGHIVIRLRDSKDQIFALTCSPYSSGKAGSVRLEPFRLGEKFEC